MGVVLNQRGGEFCSSSQTDSIGYVRGATADLLLASRGWASEADHRTAQTAVTGEHCEKLSVLYGRFKKETTHRHRLEAPTADSSTFHSSRAVTCLSVLYIPLIFDVTLGTREEYFMVALFFETQTLSECFWRNGWKKRKVMISEG